MNKIYLPLKLWGLVGIIVLVCVAILSQNWRISEDDRAKSEILNTVRLTKKTRKYHIIALGNSLLAYGLPFDNIIKEKLRKKNLDVQINRLTLSGMDSEYFVSILPQILDAKPDLIVLQSEFFSVNFNYYNIDNFHQNIVKLRTLIQPRSIDGNYYVNREYPKTSKNNLISTCENIFFDKSEFERNAKQAYKNINIGVNEKLDSYLPFIDQAQRSGIEVIFLEIGRSAASNQFLGDQNQAAITDSLQKISSKTGAKVWRFPANLSLNYYCDLAHLNNHGQKIFTNWFIDRIKLKLQKNQH